MAYIPAGALWYIAEIVERIRVEGSLVPVVHVNFCLLRADSPEDALARARRKGKDGEIRYPNPEGREVSVEFLGLRELHVVHDALEDGAELLFEEHVGLTDAAASALVRADADLAVFRPIEPTRGPDYSA